MRTWDPLSVACLLGNNSIRPDQLVDPCCKKRKNEHEYSSLAKNVQSLSLSDSVNSSLPSSPRERLLAGDVGWTLGAVTVPDSVLPGPV